MALTSFCMATVAICERIRLMVRMIANIPMIDMITIETTRIVGSMSVSMLSRPASGLVASVAPSPSSSWSTSGFVMV